MSELDNLQNGIQGGSLQGGSLNTGNINANLGGNVGTLPIDTSLIDKARIKFGNITIEEEPLPTGRTQIVEETITYSEEERKDNAMTLAEKMSDLTALKEEYAQLINDTNEALRQKREEIDALQKEIEDMNIGVVDGQVTVENEYDVYETSTQNILVEKGKTLSSDNIKNIVNKTQEQIEAFAQLHPNIVEPEIENEIEMTEPEDEIESVQEQPVEQPQNVQETTQQTVQTEQVQPSVVPENTQSV